MEKYNDLGMSDLLDLLSQYTAKYSQMLTDGCDPRDFEKYKADIESIQNEISNRKDALQENESRSAISESDQVL
jgi:hypothetical protein